MRDCLSLEHRHAFIELIIPHVRAIEPIGSHVLDFEGHARRKRRMQGGAAAEIGSRDSLSVDRGFSVVGIRTANFTRVAPGARNGAARNDAKKSDMDRSSNGTAHVTSCA